jgi:hypothetical protein
MTNRMIQTKDDIPPLPYRRDVDNVKQVDFLDSVPEKRKEPVYE